MSIAEKIRAYLRIILLAVIPIINVIIGTILLFSNTIQNEIMEKLREENIS